MALRAAVMTAVLAVSSTGTGWAEGLAIEHEAIGCIVAGAFPRLQARIEPAADVARARVNFRAEGGPHWYWVEMKPEQGTFVGVLPKPTKDLRRMEYYMDAMSRTFGEGRTPEHRPAVVADAGGCSTMRAAASLASTATSILLGVPAGAPVIPLGFSGAGVVVAAGSAGAAGAAGAGAGAAGGGGVSTTALVVGGVAVAGGAVVAATQLRGDEESGPIPNTFFEGHVYRNPPSSCGRSGCTDTTPGVPVGPAPLSCGPLLAGAVVSSSVSGVTATTDAQGYFYLDTGVPQPICPSGGGPPSATLTATAPGCQTISNDFVASCYSEGATTSQSCRRDFPLRCP